MRRPSTHIYESHQNDEQEKKEKHKNNTTVLFHFKTTDKSREEEKKALNFEMSKCFHMNIEHIVIQITDTRDDTTYKFICKRITENEMHICKHNKENIYPSGIINN